MNVRWNTSSNIKTRGGGLIHQRYNDYLVLFNELTLLIQIIITARFEEVAGG